MARTRCHVEVARLMVENRVQHVAVTENGVLLGLVSAMDFVEQLVHDFGLVEQHFLDDRLVAWFLRSLAYICQ